MTGFLIAGALIAWIVAIVFFGVRAMEGSLLSIACVVILLVGGFGFAFNRAIKDGDSGPCLRYETGMHYNAATKTMMPYRTCAERGEWVNE